MKILRMVSTCFNILKNAELPKHYAGSTPFTFNYGGKTFNLVRPNSKFHGRVFTTYSSPAFFDKQKKILDRFKNLTTYIDIGANLGYYATAVTAVKEFENIYLFEPSQYNFKFLNENFKNNKHAVLFQLGLSDKKDTANLAMPLGKYNNWYNKLNNTGIMSIHGQGTFRKEKIEIDTFDNLKISKMLKSDNCFVKMDIEGHEYFALLGMTSLLKEDNVFQVEINFTFGSENNGKIFDLFKSNGFTAYLYIDETDSFKEINLSNLGTSEVSDVFFVKRGMLP